MENPFDIIRVLSDDRLAWLESAQELSSAKLRVCELLADSPGEYIVYNQETKTLVSHFTLAPEVPQLLGLEEEFAGTAATGDFMQELQPALAELDDEFAEQPALSRIDTAYLHRIQPAVA